MFGPKKSAALEATSDAAPRSTWDKLLTTTPIVMTVVATILAGLSNSEMTKAQFYRALAAQNQSKAGDQWAFFQFKRARGNAHEMTIKLLASLSTTDTLTTESLRAHAEHLVRTLGRMQAKADQLAARINESRQTLGSSYESIAAAAGPLASIAREQREKAEHLKQTLSAALPDAATEPALAALLVRMPTKVETRKAADIVTDEQIRAVLHDVEQRKTEEETEQQVARINEPKLHEAIRAAEQQARAADGTPSATVAMLDRLDKLIQEESAIAQSVATATQRLSAELDELPTPPSELTRLTSHLARQSAELKSAAQAESNTLTIARLRFDERRYQREADDNRLAAGLYEVQVRKSSWNSERHRTRSGFFFFGMVAAQAGVTISSLALAVRRKSLLWGMASLAGAAAIAIAAYVYFYI